MRSQVGITGIGIVSSLGMNVEQNWENLCRRASGISRIEFLGHQAFPHCQCGGIKNYEPSTFVTNKKLLKLMNRESQLAFIAAQQALDNSGIHHHYIPDRIGLYLGTGLTSGDLENLVPIVENSIDTDGRFSYSFLGTKALNKCNPLLSFKILPNMALSYISIEHNIQGPNMVFNPWSGNAAQTVLAAKRAIELGEIDCALVGGCDSKCNYVGFLTLTHLGLLSQKGVSNPFTPEADGIIPGEGAAFIVLESFEHASRRNATIYAEICGGECSTDCSSVELYPTTSVHLESNMQGALDDAGIRVNDIDLICTSANSHPISDDSERQAIEHIFEQQKPELATLSLFTGDLMAAASVFSIGICAYSFTQEQQMPFFSNCTNDNEKKMPNGGKIQTALINAFAIGNTKASLIIRNVI